MQLSQKHGSLKERIGRVDGSFVLAAVVIVGVVAHAHQLGW
jgi:hypothetical protein